MGKLKMILSSEMVVAFFNLCFKYIPTYCYVAYRKRPSQLWLITERSTDARDNGYVLFKYLRECHPELKIYYAIQKNVADYNNVKDLGNIIKWGSIRHYYVYLMSTLLISTDFGMSAPDAMMNRLIKYFLPPKGRKVFLQHGIIKDLLPQAMKTKLFADLFICGAYPEYIFVNKYFGYTEGVVKYTGLARYDLLENTCNKNQILYIPTWRAWLKSDGFETSNFKKNIVSLLTSEKLNSLLCQTNTEFVFFLHPVMCSKKKIFAKYENIRIKIMNNEDANMQDFLKSAKLLITDYSSVYFDFAYLGKSVIYYQFDYDEYRLKHYPTGYFDYERDGFGPVVSNEVSLLNQVEYIIRNNWELLNEYKERAKSFFPLRDRNNCLRHYKELCSLDNIIPT